VLNQSAGLPMRELSPEQRAAAFTREGSEHRQIYLDTVREMEGGSAYEIKLPQGCTRRKLVVNLSRAAKQLGLKLKYAIGKDTDEYVVVELCGEDR
jgi:hypothetical protein